MAVASWVSQPTLSWALGGCPFRPPRQGTGGADRGSAGLAVTAAGSACPVRPVTPSVLEQVAGAALAHAGVAAQAKAARADLGADAVGALADSIERGGACRGDVDPRLRTIVEDRERVSRRRIPVAVHRPGIAADPRELGLQ